MRNVVYFPAGKYTILPLLGGNLIMFKSVFRKWWSKGSNEGLFSGKALVILFIGKIVFLNSPDNRMPFFGAACHYRQKNEII